MTLTLRIENYDVLENGGPPWITLEGRNACVGRGGGMDWILPDPSRHISSHHFDITFKGGKYYLTDVSTNGTFLQGQRYRLDGPHEIRNGDRFTVGHYIVGASIAQAQQPAAPPRSAPSGHRSMIQQPPTWAPAAGADDPWETIGRSPTPSYVPSAAPSHPPPQGTGGLRRPPTSYGQGTPSAPPSPPQQPSAPPQYSAPPPQSQPPQPQPPQQPAPPPPQSVPPYSVPPVAPAGGPAAMPMPRPEVTPVPVAPGPSPAPIPAAAMRPAQPAAVPASNADVFRAFCEGAGLDPAAYGEADMVRLAQQLGTCTRIAVQEIMTMLKDRAAVKHFTRGGERTMRSASGNNPMKFLPDTEQALEAMFLKPRDGFMKGPDGFENALHDIRQHQAAVFAALQPALAHVLAGLSPEEVSGEAGSGIMGGGKSRAWETFVERWDAKAETGENGMLDVFLSAFSKAYAEAVSRG